MATRTVKDKLCVALDTDSFDKAKHLVNELHDSVGLFKVGKELFTRAGPPIVDFIHSKGCKVFLDLKYHDIPNTVKAAGSAASDLGVFMFNVHACGGSAMMRAAVQGVQESSNQNTRILAVTVLTSLDQKTLNDEILVNENLEKYVVHLAQLAKSSGLSGVVASPKEIKLIRDACGPRFIILTPGIRPIWFESNDQKRIMTPKEACEAGANFIVIGRPITQAKEPREAAEKILQEMN